MVGLVRQKHLHSRCDPDGWYNSDCTWGTKSRHARVRSEWPLHRDRHADSRKRRHTRHPYHDDRPARPALPDTNFSDTNTTRVHPADTDVWQPNNDIRPTYILYPDKQRILIRPLVRVLEHLIDRVPGQLADLVGLLRGQLGAQQAHLRTRNRDGRRPLEHHIRDRAADQFRRVEG